MSNYAFGVTYDGADFYGWQRQPELPTVQGLLEAAVSQIANKPTNIFAAGRTDTGVHATGQVGAFSSDAIRSLYNWRQGMNALTPDSIHVDWVIAVDDKFHPRYSATARRYTYVFHDSGSNHPLLLRRAWGCAALDADAMHRAAQVLVGDHDFSSFRGAGCQSLSPLRRVNHCVVTRRGGFVTLDIEANSFVLHMVRNVVSALHAVGTHTANMTLAQLLAATDRQQLGATAPASGLYLVSVAYPDYGFPKTTGIPFLPL